MSQILNLLQKSIKGQIYKYWWRRFSPCSTEKFVQLQKIWEIQRYLGERGVWRVTEWKPFYTGNLSIYPECSSSFFLCSFAQWQVTCNYKFSSKLPGISRQLSCHWCKKNHPNTHQSILVNPHNSDFTDEENENVILFFPQETLLLQKLPWSEEFYSVPPLTCAPQGWFPTLAFPRLVELSNWKLKAILLSTNLQ